MSAASSELSQAIEHARKEAERAGVFASVLVQGDELVCKAEGSAEEAFYRLVARDDGLWVMLDMMDRWQSGSIEGDLMHSGDSLEELLDEEFAELGYEGEVPGYQHFRDEQKRFVFQMKVPVEGRPVDEQGETASQFLLGFEACFRQLGDMSEGEGDGEGED